MRTTVSVMDELLPAAKRRDRERGKTLSQIVEAALQRKLSPMWPIVRNARPYRCSQMALDHVRGSTSLRRVLHEALDEGLGLDVRR